MASPVKAFSSLDLMELTSARVGETKVGQRLRVLPEEESLEAGLKKAAARGARFGLLLAAEDVGPRANCGRPGADEGPRAFMESFANLQDNRFLDASAVVAVGEVRLGDLMEQSKDADLDELRRLCAEVDARVEAALRPVFEAGLEPILVGGGNNNSLPLIRALHASNLANKKESGGISVLNCDPHADFRRVEDGRHSGNPFSFAHKEGILKKYCVFGLHESYNSEDMMSRLDEAGFKYLTYESAYVRRDEKARNQMNRALRYLHGDGTLDVGLEVDLDSIAGMPSSAKTPVGMAPEQVAHLVHAACSSASDTAGPASAVRYFHLSEGAPRWGAGGGGEDGSRTVGKTAAMLVATYIRARTRWWRSQARSS